MHEKNQMYYYNLSVTIEQNVKLSICCIHLYVLCISSKREGSHTKYCAQPSAAHCSQGIWKTTISILGLNVTDASESRRALPEYLDGRRQEEGFDFLSGSDDEERLLRILISVKDEEDNVGVECDNLPKILLFGEIDVLSIVVSNTELIGISEFFLPESVAVIGASIAGTGKEVSVVVVTFPPTFCQYEGKSDRGLASSVVSLHDELEVHRDESSFESNKGIP